MDIEVTLVFTPQITNYYHFLKDFCAQLHYELTEREILNSKLRLHIVNHPNQIRKFYHAFTTLFDNIEYSFEKLENPDIALKFDYFNKYEAIRKFRFDAAATLDLFTYSKQHILLIEREGYTDRYKEEHAKRSLENHLELKEEIEKLHHDLVFRSVRLSEMEFGEQAGLFYNAKVVIGQHGAGLLNLLWMLPETHLIEIGHAFQGGVKRNMFRKLSNEFNINYIHSNPIKNNVADIDDIMAKLKNIL